MIESVFGRVGLPFYFWGGSEKELIEHLFLLLFFLILLMWKNVRASNPMWQALTKSNKSKKKKKKAKDFNFIVYID